MNERIKELVEQAYDTVRFNDAQSAKVFNTKKFAELIIKKCLDQCYYRGMNDELYAGQLKAAAYIEEYFGVEA